VDSVEEKGCSPDDPLNGFKSETCKTKWTRANSGNWSP